MASLQKYSNDQTPSRVPRERWVFFPTAFSTLMAGGDPLSDRGSPVTHEKQSTVGEGGKNFGLTPREEQVIVFVVAGYTNKDIAQKLGVSTQTIKHHVANIFDKLAVSNRLELVLFALHHRLID